MGMRASLIVVFLFAVVPVGLVRAGDLDEEPFGSRLLLSLDRVTAFTDVIGRQASTAHPLASSANPGSDDVLRDPPFQFDFLITAADSHTFFESGAWLHSVSSTAAYRLSERGTFSLTYIWTGTQENDTRRDGAISLRSNQFRPAFGIRLDECVSAGVEFGVTDGTVRYKDPLDGWPVQTSTENLTLESRLGLFFELDPQWALGVSGAFVYNRAETEGKLYLPPPPFGPGALPIDQTDRIRLLSLRFGVGFKATDELGIFGDLQYLGLHGEDDLSLGRGLLGVEYMPEESTTLRVGFSADTKGNTNVSANVGYRPPGFPLFEVVYVFNAFPEVNRELGRGGLLSFSVVFPF